MSKHNIMQSPEEDTLNPKEAKKDLVLGALILLAIVVLQGVYAVHLNQAYYSINMPFNDSMAYDTKMAVLIMKAHEQGFLSALQHAIFAPPPTSILPFLEGAILAPFLSPSRAIGIWLQVPWLWVLGASVFFYLRRFYVDSLWLSLGLTFPVISLAAIWNFDGGLSNFRVDLHLYLFWGITFTWFFITYETAKLYPWILWGIAMGLTCLARVLAPIYLFIGLAPLLVIRLSFPNQVSRAKILRNTLLGVVIAGLICGWFYIISFKEVYFYYGVRGPDGIASIPIQQSLMHIQFMLRSVGWYPIVLAAIALPFTLRDYSKQYELTPGTFFKNLDWKILWVSLAPLLFLVLMGLGTNQPFVSMPSAFGLILFLVKPFRQKVLTSSLIDTKSFIPPTHLISFASIFLMLLLAIQGINQHIYPQFIYPKMQQLRGGGIAIQSIFRIMKTDADQHRLEKPIYTVSYFGLLNDGSLNNAFMFDLKSDPNQYPIQAVPFYGFTHYAPVDFDSIPGANVSEKLAHLVDRANREVDYLIIPEQQSLESIKKNYDNIIINRYTSEIREKLVASENWVPISDVIYVNSSESVKVYRNRKRLA